METAIGDIEKLIRFGEDSVLELKDVRIDSVPVDDRGSCKIRGRGALAASEMERIVLFRRDEGVASTGEWRFCNWLDKKALHGLLAENGTVKDLKSQILEIVRSNPGVRTPTIIAATGKSRRMIARYLAGEFSSLVEFRGAPKTGGYYVKNERSWK